MVLMGTYVHVGIMATSIRLEELEKIKESAEELELVATILDPKVNSIYTLFIAPDGHKLGWPMQEQMEEARETIKSLLCEETNLVHWCEVTMGEGGSWISDSIEERYDHYI